jgi:hypothetical protein
MVYLPVSLHIARQLLAPEGSIRFWHYCVFRATMPETAINKHGQLASGKNDIRSSRKAVFQAVPATSCPQQLAQHNLRLRILATDA